MLIGITAKSPACLLSVQLSSYQVISRSRSTVFTRVRQTMLFKAKRVTTQGARQCGAHKPSPQCGNAKRDVSSDMRSSMRDLKRLKPSEM
jgi:hypothetical protein